MMKSVDPDQTPRSVCSGLSVPILRVIMLYYTTIFCQKEELIKI